MDRGTNINNVTRESEGPPCVDEPFNIGILGCGEQMKFNLLPNITSLNDIRVVSFCDIKLGRAKDLAETYNVDNIFEDLETMVETVDLDAVVAAASPQAHAELIRTCLHEEVNVFVEKPPVRDLETLDEVISLERESDAFVGVGMNFRHSHRLQTFQEIAEETFTTEPRYMNVEFVTDKPAAELWGLDSHMRSILLATGIHALDVAHLFMGQPEEVEVNTVSSDETYQMVLLNLSYENGSMCTIRLSAITPRFDFDVSLLSENHRRIRISQLDKIEVQDPSGSRHDSSLSGKRWQSSWEPSPIADQSAAGYHSELRSFVHSVRENEHPEPSLEVLRDLYVTIEETIDQVEREGANQLSRPKR